MRKGITPPASEDARENDYLVKPLGRGPSIRPRLKKGHPGSQGEAFRNLYKVQAEILAKVAVVLNFPGDLPVDSRGIQGEVPEQFPR